MNDEYAGEQVTDYEENLDWDSVGNPPPAHNFNFVFEKAEHAFSKTSGKHMVKAVMKIEAYDPKYPEDEKYIGRTVFCNFNFSQQGAFLAKQLIDVLGLDKPTAISKAILEEWANSIVGMQVGAVLNHRIFQDQKQANVQKFVPLMAVTTEVGVDDTTGGDDVAAEYVDSMAAGDGEESLEIAAREPEPPPQRRSLRDTVQQPAAPRVKVNGNGHNGTNGTNGHTNGFAGPLTGKKTTKETTKAARK